jgi:hypothetical protein
MALSLAATRSISSRPRWTPLWIRRTRSLRRRSRRWRAPTLGVVLLEDVVEVAHEQGRYAVGHGLTCVLNAAWRFKKTPSDP